MSKINKPKTRKWSGFKTILTIALICIAIYWLFFTSLSFMTRHGKVVAVPDFIGQDFATAKKDIEKRGYRIEVDSGYNPDHPGLQILDQQPRVGKKVKKGRTLFLTVNRASAPEINMPNLVNLSFRSAEMVLNSNKLVLGDTIVKPDLAEGAVIEMHYKGNKIRANDRIKQGERIDLIIGGGLKEMEFEVPDLIGFTYDEVINLLSSYSLHPNITYEGNVVDTYSVVVMGQSPKPMNNNGEPNMIKENKVIHIKMREPLMEGGVRYNDGFYDEEKDRYVPPSRSDLRNRRGERQPKYEYSN